MIDDNTIIGIGNLPKWNQDSNSICQININTGQIIKVKSSDDNFIITSPQ